MERSSLSFENYYFNVVIKMVQMSFQISLLIRNTLVNYNLIGAILILCSRDFEVVGIDFGIFFQLSVGFEITSRIKDLF